MSTLPIIPDPVQMATGIAPDQTGLDAVPASPEAPGILNSLAANTIGVLWSAASGTVDPWTKKEVIYDSSVGSLAPGGAQRIQDTTGITPDQLMNGSEATVTQVLTAEQADPSQFSLGLQKNLSKLGALSTGTLLLIGAVAILVIVASRS